MTTDPILAAAKAKREQHKREAEQAAKNLEVRNRVQALFPGLWEAMPLMREPDDMRAHLNNKGKRKNIVAQITKIGQSIVSEGFGYSIQARRIGVVLRSRPHCVST